MDIPYYKHKKDDIDKEPYLKRSTEESFQKKQERDIGGIFKKDNEKEWSIKENFHKKWNRWTYCKKPS